MCRRQMLRVEFAPDFLKKSGETIAHLLPKFLEPRLSEVIPTIGWCLFSANASFFMI